MDRFFSRGHRFSGFWNNHVTRSKIQSSYFCIYRLFDPLYLLICLTIINSQIRVLTLWLVKSTIVRYEKSDIPATDKFYPDIGLSSMGR